MEREGGEREGACGLSIQRTSTKCVQDVDHTQRHIPGEERFRFVFSRM